MQYCSKAGDLWTVDETEPPSPDHGWSGLSLVIDFVAICFFLRVCEEDWQINENTLEFCYCNSAEVPIMLIGFLCKNLYLLNVGGIVMGSIVLDGVELAQDGVVSQGETLASGLDNAAGGDMTSAFSLEYFIGLVALIAFLYFIYRMVKKLDKKVRHEDGE